MMSLTAFALSLFALTASARPQDDPFSFGGGDVSSTGPTSIPTGPVIALTFPADVDQQILIGSVIATAGPLTTLAISCPEGTDPNDCGFDPPITLTAGPSTLHYSIAYDDYNTIDQACQFSAVGGQCQITEVGIQSDLVTATNVDTFSMTGISTTTTVTSFGADQLVSIDVTIVGGQTAGLSVVSTATATGVLSESSTNSDSLFNFGTMTASSSSQASATKTSSTHSGSSSSSSSGSASAASSSTTRSPNAAATLVPGAAGLGLMGLAALLL